MFTRQNPTKFLIYILLACAPIRATAQQYVDVLKVEHLESIGQTFDTSNARVPLQETSIDLTIPIRKANLTQKGVVLLTGFTAEHNRVSLNPGARATTFYSLMGKIGLVKKHGAQWSGTYMLLPKLNSDFQSIGKNDFQIGGIAILKHEKSTTLNYKIGNDRTQLNSDFGNGLVLKTVLVVRIDTK